MTSSGPGGGASSMTSPRSNNVQASRPDDDGPYVLQPWIDAVPLSVDGSRDDIKINCVEYFDGNLYVGTSASELLHLVSIPPDASDRSGKPVFIPASRICPAFSENSTLRPGVQQILLLPQVGKACILCNGTVTFYSLPELSPVFGTKQVKNCNWIGGIDLNEPNLGYGGGNAVAILLSLNRRIQVVEIDEDARVIKNIDFAGSTLSVRRDSIACVADSKTYALIDVNRQLKIPLMTISSLEEDPSLGEIGQAQILPSNAGDGIVRSASSAQSRPQTSAQGHNRSQSLGGSILGNIQRHEPYRGEAGGRALETPSPPRQPSSPQPPSESGSTPPPTTRKPLLAPPSGLNESLQAPSLGLRPVPVFLKPHITSPTPEEFLLVMGTGPLEPGVGMFINLDGDPTRPTITFDRYPKEIVVDGGLSETPSSTSAPSEDDDDGYVIASMARGQDGSRNGLEIQRWDAGSESQPEKHWLEAADVTGVYGIRALTSSQETQFDEIVEKLSMRKFVLFPDHVDAVAPVASLSALDSRTALSIERLSREQGLLEHDYDSQNDDSLPEGWETARTAEGEEFARRLAKSRTRIAVWCGNRIWWAVRNPLMVQLDRKLGVTCPAGHTNVAEIDKRAIVMVLSAIQGREPKTELVFTTFGYLQQKAGVLLLIHLLLSPADKQFSDAEMVALEEVLVESKVDPRVVLSLIPGVRNEIIEGRRGIWVYGGVKEAPEAFLRSSTFQSTAKDGIRGLAHKALHFLRRYLQAWRKMKGFGSVSVEGEVFRTVDAALLLVLLELDQHSSKGAGKGGAVRAELNDLVDSGMDCFDRAIGLLESYHRLFVLSRLYQSRKMSAEVLSTWKRIIEGEQDDGQELRNGEQRVRDYLTKVSSQTLVQEYGLWLANRNPKLGVQIFAEDKGRAPAFEPARVVRLLREKAPGAVKYFLEHLVFSKGYASYVKELITYYLDVVIGDLQSEASRDKIVAAYDVYKALQAPKPTYRHFLTEKAPDDDEVWQSRLRLLQLLGGAHEYDVAAIRKRISSLPGDPLVPETIILAGREHRHEDALRFLVHRLGDYDTAVSYCLRGGASIYSPSPGGRGSMPDAEQRRRLFQVVLREFLTIDDVSDKVEQTGALLERFGGWFEVDDVLRLVPDGWSVDIIAGFLVGALRRLVQEKHEGMLTRALSGAENLRVSYDLVMRMDEKGRSVEAPPN